MGIIKKKNIKRHRTPKKESVESMLEKLLSEDKAKIELECVGEDIKVQKTGGIMGIMQCAGLCIPAVVDSMKSMTKKEQTELIEVMLSMTLEAIKDRGYELDWSKIKGHVSILEELGRLEEG